MDLFWYPFDGHTCDVMIAEGWYTNLVNDLFHTGENVGWKYGWNLRFGAILNVPDLRMLHNLGAKIGSKQRSCNLIFLLAYRTLTIKTYKTLIITDFIFFTQSINIIPKSL